MSFAEMLDDARRRIHDIASFQLPRLRECSSSLADHNQLALELREDMDAVSRLVEELAVAIDDQQDEQARRELELAVNEMRDSLLQYASRFACPLILNGRQAQAEKRHPCRSTGF